MSRDPQLDRYERDQLEADIQADPDLAETMATARLYDRPSVEANVAAGILTLLDHEQQVVVCIPLSMVLDAMLTNQSTTKTFAIEFNAAVDRLRERAQTRSNP